LLHPADRFSAPLEVSFIHCERHVHFGTREGYYEAVSYCWGALDRPHVVSIKDHAGQLIVTANVDLILSYLRKSTKNRKSWIDVLCIDQEDAVEKAVQVQKLGEIYREAAKVHVWLGAAVPTLNMEAVFTYLRQLAMMDEACDGVQGPRSPNLGLNNFLLVKDIHLMLSLPWLQRRWILQEVSLGHDI
jgi:hypothetical protein